MSLLKRRQIAPRSEYFLCCLMQVRCLSSGQSSKAIPSSTTLSIGDVRVPIPDYTLHPERVSWSLPGVDDSLRILLKDEEGVKLESSSDNMFFSLRDARTRKYLRWMCQKELLGQDMCLVGDPGPAMRWLVQLYSYVTRREIRVVHLNRDVTESDLKQRREIQNGTLIYEDQGAVTAAKEGQLLVLEGLERVERNVLPVINNLLENREMHLDNGNSLIHPQRYDTLVTELVQSKTCANAEAARQELLRLGLLRVSERFRVIGITVPVPPYEGNPLDPPLRSRFQCLYVNTPQVNVGSLAAGPKSDAKLSKRLEPILKLQSAVNAINESTKDFQNASASASAKDKAIQVVGNYELGVLTKILGLFPDRPVGDILAHAYPWILFARQAAFSTASAKGAQEAYDKLLGKYLKVLTGSSIGAPLLSGLPPTAGGRSSLQRFVQSPGLLQRGRIDTGAEEEGNYVRVIKPMKRVMLLKDSEEQTAVNVGEATIASSSSGGGGGFGWFRSGTTTLPIMLGAHSGAGDVDVGGTVPLRGCIFTAEHYHLLQELLQLHIAGQHTLIIGPTGCGKTALIREFAALLGYEEETTHLYADMTNKDLFQRRTTDAATGNTTWENAALVEGAIHGRLVILDGVDKLSPGMLSSLQQLLVDKNAVLFDGTILKSVKEYEELKERMHEYDEDGRLVRRQTDADMRRARIYPIHPAFRVIATAHPPYSDGGGSAGGAGSGAAPASSFTVSHEVTTLFSVVAMPDATEKTLRPLLQHVARQELEAAGAATGASEAQVHATVDQLLRLRAEFEELRRTEDAKVSRLSVRQLLHLTRVAVHFPEDVALNVASSILLPLMTGVTETLVSHALHKCGIRAPERPSSPAASSSSSSTDGDGGEELRAVPGEAGAFAIGGRTVLRLPRQYTQEELTLVPFVTGFFPNRIHESIIGWLAKQYAMRSNILLIGTQGVGKNKVVDAFLARVRVPRHYLQLHRDTTVGSLTINPSVQGGKLCWEDSPLVKAVQRGHCLVIDEIDKASVEVVQILKGLIEDREMRLSDGRRVLEAAAAARLSEDERRHDRVVVIHPDFRVIVLANPPGFPFHGNDFFRECGDLFSSYVMENPDHESQLRVLRSYGPGVPVHVLKRLIDVFEMLQRSFQQGNITYPFSLRELIAVVKHLAKFPQDGVYQAMNNVFFFDARDDNTMLLVRRIMHTCLGPLASAGMQRLLPLRIGKPTTLVPLPAAVELPMVASSAAGGGTPESFALDLPLQVVCDAAAVGAHLGAAPLPEVPCWTEYFADSAFASSPSRDASGGADGDDDAAAASRGFTEWASTVRLPFIHPQTDRVLKVLPLDRTSAVGGGDDVDGTDGLAPPPAVNLVTVLIHRKDDTERFLLATVRLPATSIDDPFATSAAGTAAAAEDSAFSAASAHPWRVGEVRLADVTALVHAGGSSGSGSGSGVVAPADVTLRQVDLSTHAAVWGGLRPPSWPSSISASTRAVFPPVVYLQARVHGSSGSGVASSPAFLVDASLGGGGGGTTDAAASAAASAQEEQTAPLRVSPAAAATAAEPAPKKQRTEAAATAASAPDVRRVAQPLNISALADTSSPSSVAAAAPVLFHSASSRNGALVFSRGNVALPLVSGSLLAVTLPVSAVRSFDFVTAQLAMLTFAPLPGASGAAGAASGKAVVKLYVPPPSQGGEPVATLAYLPKDIEGVMVDRAAAATAMTARLAPADLEGTVWSSNRADSPVAYMTLNKAHGGTYQFSVYPTAVRDAHPSPLQPRGSDGAAATVAPQQHQLLQHSADKGGLVVTNTLQHHSRTLSAPPLAALASDLGRQAAADDAVQYGVQASRGTVYAHTARAPDRLSLADVDLPRVEQRYANWSALLRGSVDQVGNSGGPDGDGDGSGEDNYEMKYSTPRKQPSGTLKHGETDDKEHHGGNTWAGGTGGTDTAGLGGMIGPYRLDKGNPVHQVSPEEKKKVPPHLIAEAKRMGREALLERLREIGMSESEYADYKAIQERVEPSVVQLRTLLKGLRAAEGERVWAKGQTDGIWDDKKIVEGIVGEKNVFKRRVDSKDANPFAQRHKKRVLFVMDVSASMYRFEGHDRRLTKLLESTIMIMEAFAGFEQKIDYSMIGHNGDSECLPLVDFGAPPANQKERMVVCQKMIAYAQYCWSGDNTVEAMRKSVELVTAEKGDAYFVFVVSDANLRQYGITPAELTSIIQSHREVQMFCIFIASLGAQASQLQRQLPAGHGYECMRADLLPQVLRQIFVSVSLL